MSRFGFAADVADLATGTALFATGAATIGVSAACPAEEHSKNGTESANSCRKVFVFTIDVFESGKTSEQRA